MESEIKFKVTPRPILLTTALYVPKDSDLQKKERKGWANLYVATKNADVSLTLKSEVRETHGPLACPFKED